MPSCRTTTPAPGRVCTARTWSSSGTRSAWACPVAVAGWALLRGAVGSGSRAALLSAGGRLGWRASEVVHYGVRAGGGGGRLVRFWRRHHFYHHYAGDRRCCGFRTPLWDYVFGTGPAPDPARRSRAAAESTR